METKTKMKRIWDNYVVVGEVRKSEGIKLVVAAATREGFRYLNIREFYMRKRDGEWRPGRDGITIPLKASINKGASFISPFEDMLALIQKASDVVSTLELMDEKNAVWAEWKGKQ